MSRIGRRPVEVPKGVEISVQERSVRVKGPKGDLTLNVHPSLSVKMDGGAVQVERPSDAAEHKALHGLTRTLIANMVSGVTEGYQKALEIQGVGYKAERSGKGIKLSVGFSHTVQYDAPPGITIDLPNPTTIHIKAPTSRWSVRWRPSSARCSRRSRTRVRESDTRASRSGGRPARRLGHNPWRRAGISGRAARSRARADTSASGRRCGARPSGRGLVVYRSLKNIEGQLVNDDDSRTVIGLSTLDAGLRDFKSESDKNRRVQHAKAAGKALAAKAKEKGIEAVVFDRGGYKYHGRVRAFAEGAREGGLKF
jgi:large subunit ribosomal protein L6